MLRLLIGTGLVLMVLGFGAAGLQYARGSAAGDAAAQGPVATLPANPWAQAWLISPTGTPLARAEVRAFLEQDRFVPGRSLRVTMTAQLAELLAEGEKLPEAAYLQVLADIRAPRLAETLCPVLTDSIATACAVHAARVAQGSVDSARGTARFDIELAYRLRPQEEALPDPSAHVLAEDLLEFEIATGDATTVAAALAAAVAATTEVCTGRGVGSSCRLMEMRLDWSPRSGASGLARTAWLSPMPKGMSAAPPLGSPTGD